MAAAATDTDDIIEITPTEAENSQPKGIKRKKSPVWTYFTITDMQRKDWVTCDLCEKTVKTKDSSTTNLLNHLSTTHPEQYQLVGGGSKRHKKTDAQPQSTAEQQPTLRSVLERKTKYPNESTCHKQLTDLVRDYLCTGMYGAWLFLLH